MSNSDTNRHTALTPYFAHQYAVPWIVPERMALAEASEELAQAIQDLGGTVSGIQRAGRDGTDLELAARAPGWGEEMTFLLRNDGVVLYTIAGSSSGFGGIRVPDPPGDKPYRQTRGAGAGLQGGTQ